MISVIVLSFLKWSRRRGRTLRHKTGCVIDAYGNIDLGGAMRGVPLKVVDEVITICFMKWLP
jgi:hypothetical protein